jgi:hypothetical protein
LRCWRSDRFGWGTEASLSQALAHPAPEHWTGITVRDEQPGEHLDLWLAMNTSQFSRLSVDNAARESDLAGSTDDDRPHLRTWQ